MRIMDTKPLYIPPSKKLRGMTVYCNKCKTDISELCKETGKSITKCPFGDRHVFKIYLHIPGTKNGRKTKTLDTRNIDEAMRLALEFQKEIYGNINSGNEVKTVVGKKENTIKEVKQKESNTPLLLIHAMARYIGFLNNEGVPAHRKKERSKDHIKNVELAFKNLAQCLTHKGYDLTNLEVLDINDNLVGDVYSYLSEKKFANRTFNKYLSYYTSFLKWYADEYNSPIRNWFERINRKRVSVNPQSITLEEFEQLLKQITFENGERKYEQGVKHTRNFYRPWLADGFRLALETGRRREEVINLKFSDIEEKNGVPLFIKSEDYKVNRIQHRDNESKKYIYIPVTKSLHELLMELGYGENKNQDKYILAPEVEITRKRIMSDVLSRGFSHYYNKLNTGRKLTFKSLRKTYITNLSLYMGGNTKAITGHSDDAVIERHYLDKQMVAKAAKNFQIFSKEPERIDELKDLRIEIDKQQKNIER